MKKAILGICLLLGGCMVGPNYKPPENCVPDTWSSDPCCSPDYVAAWWETFQDSLLDWVVEQAVCNNNDIATATATIFQARALRQMAASSLFPQIGLDANVSRTYFSKNGPVFDIGLGETSGATGLPFEVQVPQIQNIYTALIDVSWEIDFFGRIRRGVESADATIGSAIEQRNGVLISVIGEVARNYIDLRSAQQKGVLIEENLSLLEQEVAVVRKRWEKGLVDRLNVEQVEAELSTLESTLPQICTQIYRSIYALSVLTGTLPETLLGELLPIHPLPEAPCEVACGLRSDLLRRRPDVRRAERDLAAATADIGVAVASFFPSISFIGDLGLQSLTLRKLFRGRSQTWAIGGISSLPIFQGGNLVGNLRLSEGEAAAAAFTYQQTVLSALEEAESNLMAYRQEVTRACHLGEAVQRYEVFNALSEEQFDKGLVSVTNVLDSGRQLNTSKQDLLESETSVLLDLVALYKAFGGGWEAF